jgi:DNA-binding Lrp family transcriptional regulator
MAPHKETNPAAIDELDRQILHALQVAPRVPFARMATVLGVSEQTAARRYQRMRTNGLVRVLGRTDYNRLPGTTSWTLRIGCRPGTAHATAEALARRPDTSWVGIGAGGAELSCQLIVTEPLAGRESLLHHLPRASNVLTFTAHQMLHRFAGRGEADWIGVERPLSEDQRNQLRAATLTTASSGRAPADASADASATTIPVTASGDDTSADASPGRSAAGAAGRTPASGSSARTSPVASSGGAEITPGDRPLLAALARDGRASYAALAAATGWNQRQVAQRMSTLLASGALYLDVDAAITSIGFRALATLWFTVAPAHLASVGARLADHPELAFAGAVTGSANLMASAVCRDAEALYRYITTKVAAIDEVRTLETVPLMTRVKQQHFLLQNGILRDPII